MKNNFNSKHNHKNANPNNSKMKGYDFMKKTNKFAAFALAACMMAPMTMATTASFTASAAGTPVTSGSITIDSSVANHKYTAYQIFDADLTEESGNITFANVKWGSAIDTTKTATLYTELAAYLNTLNGTSKTLSSASEVAEAIKAVQGSLGGATQREALDDIADMFAKCISDSATGVNLAYDGSNSNYKGTISDPGYYLVIDTKDSGVTSPTQDNAYSRYMLLVAGDSSIAPKASYPTVEKKVKENVKAITGKATYETSITEKWNDVADYNIGDVVPFKLYGTMPDTLDDYEHYYYQFSDSLGSQFEVPENIKVYIDGKEITPESGVCEVSTAVAIPGTRGPELMVKFNDIKSIDLDEKTAGTQSLTKDSIVTIEYTAVLNSKAEIGLPGQENKVKLEYSNNPNATGDGTTKPGDTGETPEDKVIVFTYELDTTKVDGIDNTKKLENAEFKLYRMNGSTKEYVKVDADSKVAGWTDTAADATTLISDTNGLFKVIGLDDGTYYLEETKAPSGYNKLTNAVEVVITATTANNQSWNSTPADALTELNVTAGGNAGTGDVATGIASINIANNKGSTLPSTGGIGTTIFYVLGGTLVVGSGIALVTKKRLGKNED